MAEAASAVTTEETFPRRFGRFTLLEVLGTGGMGRVYRAWLEGPNAFRKMVAVKVLTERDRDPDNQKVVLASIRNEARIGALLRHPGVTEVYDYGVHEGVPWISMEAVDGIDLELMMRKCAPLPPATIVDLGLQLCSALDYAHDFTDGEVKVHLVHRDLKPGNVLIDRFGRVKITDFGIARSTLATGVTTVSGVLKGTPTFMAPEQILGRGIDARTDLFAVGAILYEATTGKRLLRRDGVAATVAAVLAVDELTEIGGGFDGVDAILPGMARVLRGCLAKDPDRRYASAEELGEALFDLLVQQPTLVGGSRDGLGALVRKVAGGQRWLRASSDNDEATPSDAFARTPTDVLLAQLGLTPRGDTQVSAGPANSEPAGRAVFGRTRTLADRLPRVRARGPEALLVAMLALLAGTSGGAAPEASDEPAPLREPAPFDAVFVEMSRPMPAPVAKAPDDVEAQASPRARAPRTEDAGPPPRPRDEIQDVDDVEVAPTLVRERAEHRRVAGAVPAGSSRSFIVETQGLQIAHVRMFLRSEGQEAWQHRALSEVAAGYWGAVVQFPSEAAGRSEYWFEVQPDGGEAYVLDAGGAPWTVEITGR